MTPREIIAKAAAGDDWRDGEYRVGMGETRNADELNAGHRATADRILEALHSAGYRILGPGERDKETDHPATRVYGMLLHLHLEEARKEFHGKRRSELFEFIERFRSEFPDECKVWDDRYGERALAKEKQG